VQSLKSFRVGRARYYFIADRDVRCVTEDRLSYATEGSEVTKRIIVLEKPYDFDMLLKCVPTTEK